MRRSIFIGMVLVFLIGGGVVAFLLMGIPDDNNEQDQQDGLVEVTPSLLFSPTIFASATSTATPSATPTSTASATPSPTLTPTLAVRVVHAEVILPDVTLPPSATPFPDNLHILAAPPDPVEPMPNATLLPFPYADFTDWVAFESDHPAMRYIEGNWESIGSLQASQGQYHYTEDTTAKVQFTFTGEAVRVRYVGFTNGGIWQVVINGMIADVIDSYAPDGLFTGTQVYYLGAGGHRLELHNTANTHPASTGHMLAFDAVQVYRSDDLTLILPDGVLPPDTPTSTLIPAQSIQLLEAPPSPQPTATEVPIQIVSASIVIGYDENANGVIDVSEGVRGISVRLVEVGTNRVVAHAFTHEQGVASLQAETNAQVQLVVPYLGQSWMVQPRSSGAQQTFTLLLSPGNQPGLIP